MTSHGDYLARGARPPPQRKVRAAGVFAEHAEVIVAALPDVPEGHVLVAVVDDDHEFTGTHHVAQDELVERVPELEAGGWAMVFTAGADVAAVRRRTDEMADLARRRAEMITRIRPGRSVTPAGIPRARGSAPATLRQSLSHGSAHVRDPSAT